MSPQDQVQDGIDFQLDEVIDDAQGVVDERDEQDDELSLVDEGDITEAQVEQVPPVETAESFWVQCTVSPTKLLYLSCFLLAS